MVVVTIIVLLTGIVMSNFGQAKAKSRDSKRVSDLAQLQLAMELFFDRCNQYPIKDNTNPPDNPIPPMPKLDYTCGSGITLGSFISKIPVPPTAGDYTYGVNDPTTPTDYVLRAKLEVGGSILADEINGPSVHGVDCENSPNFYYCVVPK